MKRHQKIHWKCLFGLAMLADKFFLVWRFLVKHVCHIASLSSLYLGFSSNLKEVPFFYLQLKFSSIILWYQYSLSEEFHQTSPQSVLDICLCLRSLIFLFILRKGRQVIDEDQDDLRDESLNRESSSWIAGCFADLFLLKPVPLVAACHLHLSFYWLVLTKIIFLLRCLQMWADLYSSVHIHADTQVSCLSTKLELTKKQIMLTV